MSPDVASRPARPPRPRCPAHELALADDGLCARCRGPRRNGAVRGALWLAGALAVLATLFGLSRDVGLVEHVSLDRHARVRGQLLEVTEFTRDEAHAAEAEDPGDGLWIAPPDPEPVEEPEDVVGGAIVVSAVDAPVVGVVPRVSEDRVVVEMAKTDRPTDGDPIETVYGNSPRGPTPPPRPRRGTWTRGAIAPLGYPRSSRAPASPRWMVQSTPATPRARAWSARRAGRRGVVGPRRGPARMGVRFRPR